MRLVSLGFSKDQAREAFLACDKNEDLAANFLFDGGVDKKEYQERQEALYRMNQTI